MLENLRNTVHRGVKDKVYKVKIRLTLFKFESPAEKKHVLECIRRSKIYSRIRGKMNRVKLPQKISRIDEQYYFWR